MKDIIIKLGILIVGILLGILVNCSGKKNEDIIKTNTIVKYIKKIDTIENNKPILVYRNKEIIKTINKSDTIIKDFKLKDYQYEYNKNDSITDLYIKGWGSLDSLKIINKHKDKIIEITNTETIYKSSNGLFISGEYNIPFNKNNVLNTPIYKTNLDYIIRNKVIIGGSIGIQGNNLYYGGKIGFKL
jgi:hypothetical protein